MSLNSLEGYRLSPQQARLWALQQQHPTLPSQARVTLTCVGKLEMSALARALDRVVQRYEILRTTFQQLPEMTLPLQVIHAEGKFAEVRLLESNNECEQQIGDCAQLPSVRATVELAGDEKTSKLHLELPALCTDTTTLRGLGEAIARAYAEDRLLPDPMQYADIAEWQNELLESEETREGRVYWQQQPAEEGARLPFEFVLPATPPFQPACLRRSLLVEPFERLSQILEVDLESLLLALWKLVLLRLVQPEQLAVGVTTNGRFHAELSEALGLLAKSLPVTTDWNRELSGRQFCQGVARSLQDTCQWQDYFGGTSAPMSVGFELATGFSELLGGGVAFSLQQYSLYLEPYQLKLTAIPQGNRLDLEFHYNANSFEPAAIAQIAATFQTALDRLLATPDAPVGRLDLLSSSDRQYLLATSAPTPAPSDVCVHQWVEMQARCHPNALAVTDEGRSLTYAELDVRANQIAWVLQQWGVGLETRVALYLDRSLAAIAGLLGILKAGGAYVPIDPDLPLGSVAWRMQETGATVVVTEPELARRLRDEVTEVHTLCLDGDWSEIGHAPTTAPVSAVCPDNLVYILFTSGSTGTPKGVAIAHRQLIGYVDSIVGRLALGNDSSTQFALISTLAADLGNTTLFASLRTGGCLHAIARDRALDPEALADYCQANPIDVLKIVPSHLAVLLSGTRASALLPRQQLVLGGEVCHWEDVARVRQHSPHCRVVNHYGPTETTVGAIAGIVPLLEAARDSETVPLGTPLANARVYLLDEALQLVPFGAAGEIYIGGVGVARGYWQRPGWTAAAFVPDPFSSEPGARLYKSGDRARWRLDGTLEFLGRNDAQVKIRGYRVELGEVEAILRSHPKLEGAVVLARGSQRSRQLADATRPEVSSGRNAHQVAAYVVAGDTPPSVAQLRQFLAERLLEPAVPSAISVLDSFPLLPNGKIDRQALLALETPESAGKFVPPQSPIEEAIARAWCEVLGVERVGRHDSFFELGGDSILCIQAIARATQAGVRFTPKQLFEHPTVAELAPVANTAPTPPIENAPVVGSVPLTPIQHWFFEQDFPQAQHWNQSVLVQSQVPFDPIVLQRAFGHLVAHHDALRLRFEQETTGWQQWNAEVPAQVSVLQVDLSALPASMRPSALEAAAKDLQSSFDLQAGLLLRVALFEFAEATLQGRSSSGQHAPQVADATRSEPASGRNGHQVGDGCPQRLLVLAHHLVVDGVSWRILLADLQQAYRQLQRGEPVRLPPKTTAFKTWAQRLQDYARSEALRSQLDYWQTVVAAPTVVLPLDFPDGSNRIADAQTIASELSQSETQALLQEVPAAYHTQIDEILLTALAMAVLDPDYCAIAGQLNGQEAALRVDLEGHGREDLFEDIDLSRTVGWFTTLFTVCLRLDSSQGLGDRIKSVKEQLRRVPQEGIGYGVLRYLSRASTWCAFRPEEDLPCRVASAFPSATRAQLRFNYLGQTDTALTDKDGLSPAAESPGRGRSDRGWRPYLLDISGWVSEGQLRLRWDYSGAIHRRETVERLANGYLQALRSLVRHCQSPEAGGFTPSDFPDADLDQSDLDQLLTQLD